MATGTIFPAFIKLEHRPDPSAKAGLLAEVAATENQTGLIVARLDAVNENLGAILLRTGTGGVQLFGFNPEQSIF